MRRLSIFASAFLVVLELCLTNAYAQGTSSLKPAGEKVFILTDKEAYAPGDTIFFKGYIADPSQAPVSRYLYVELLNQSLDRNGESKKNFMPKVLEWAKVPAVDGEYYGILPVPEPLASGVYVVRAYTLAQKDAPGQTLFHKSITIDPAENIQQATSSDAGSANSTEWKHETGPVSVELARARKIWKLMDQSDFAPGQREMIQKIHFSVFTSRKKLPKKYEVGIASDDLGLYLSYHVEEGRILNPDGYANAYLEIEDKGASSPSSCNFALSVPDFYDGVSFVINITGSFFIYPVAGEPEYAPFFDYSSTGDGTLSQVENYHKYNDRRVKDPDDEIKADTLNALVVAADSKPGFIRTKGQVGPYTSVVEARAVRTRDEMKIHDDMNLLTYIVSSYPGLYLKAGPSGRFITSNRIALKMIRTAGENGEPEYEVGNPIPPIYIDGMLSDWTEAAYLKVADVENVFVLKGADAALYRTDLVVLLQLRGSINGFSRNRRDHNNTIVLKPMGVKNLLLLEEK